MPEEIQNEITRAQFIAEVSENDFDCEFYDATDDIESLLSDMGV
jgi:hypothetical protein